MKIISKSYNNKMEVVGVSIWNENPQEVAVEFSAYIKDEEGNIISDNVDFISQVDAFAGEGFFDNNIKGILADDS